MRISLIVNWVGRAVLAGAVAGCAGAGLSAPEVQVRLSGANEVPPNTSTATGKASFWVHADRTVNGIVETSGLDGTAANLYVGAKGAVGPLAVQLVRTSTEGPVAMEQMPISGASWSVPRSARLDEAQYRAYLAGEMYINVHSARHPDGEIRGQLRP
jgi:hypothetical protein